MNTRIAPELIGNRGIVNEKARKLDMCTVLKLPLTVAMTALIKAQNGCLVLLHNTFYGIML